MNYRKQVADFNKKHNIKTVTSEELCRALNEQGYTIIEFNGIADNEDVAALRDALGIGAYMKQSRCFTYRSDKYRMVFIHEDLVEDERLVALAHEEGHIWNDHLTKDNIIGRDVIQEHQANEFAHYLLKDKNGKRKRTRTMAVVCAAAIVLGTILGIQVKKQYNAAVYTDYYYRTESGNHYHLRNCMYLEDRTDVYRLTKKEFESGEYEPCEACKPDENEPVDWKGDDD